MSHSWWFMGVLVVAFSILEISGGLVILGGFWVNFGGFMCMA